MTSGLKKTRQIFILDCCDTRFSKIGHSWVSEADINEEVSVELFTGQRWKVIVYLVLPVLNSENHNYLLDVIFLRSSDKVLFEKLCNSLGEKDGWFENEKACSNVPTK